MKRDWLLRRVSRITTTVLVAVVLLACATVVNAAEEKQDDRWRFMIAPYLWLPTISGTTRLNLPSGGSGLVDYHVGPGDFTWTISDSLECSTCKCRRGGGRSRLTSFI